MDGGRVLVGVIKRVVGPRLSMRAEAATYMVGFGLLDRLHPLDQLLRHHAPGGG